MKRGLFLIVFIFIISINFISAFNFKNTTSTQGKDFNFGGSTTITTFSGNLTNFSQMADSNTGNIAPNNHDGITWDSTIMKWVATILNSDLIWGRNTGTNTIFPLNDSNLDMSDGGGNVTATFFFGDVSQTTGLNDKFLFTNGSNSDAILNISPNDFVANNVIFY